MEEINRIFARNLEKLLKENNMTQREFATKINMHESTVGKWLSGKSIPRMGLVEKISEYFKVEKSDLLQVKDSSRKSIKVPILGVIAAGMPIYCDENIDGYMNIPYEWHIDFALKVKGISMIDAGISTGSIVLCKQSNCAENGDIAVCLVDGDTATLKRVKYYENVMVLHPENSNMADMVFSGSDQNRVKILGIAKKVIKEI